MRMEGVPGTGYYKFIHMRYDENADLINDSSGLGSGRPLHDVSLGLECLSSRPTRQLHSSPRMHVPPHGCVPFENMNEREGGRIMRIEENAGYF